MTVERKQKSKQAPRLIRRFRSKVRADLYAGDALAFLNGLKSGTASVVFLDPPFNLGKRYGSGVRDRQTTSLYREWMNSILEESTRVLADGGALYLYHLPSWAIQFAPKLAEKLTFRHWIAISMKNGFVRGERLYPAHYSLLFFTKGAPGRFHRPKLAIEYCACGRTKKSYGGYLHIVKAKGVNLSDVWDDVSPVRHRSTKRRAANELPSRIGDRIVAISGKRGGVFVDPFAGSGSAIEAAAKAGMLIKACDVVTHNTRLQAKRLEALASLERT